MRTVWRSFIRMLSSIYQDKMLLAMCFIPLLCGAAFKLGIPALEKNLSVWLSRPLILPPYYALFDLIFSMLTPVMFCFAAAMAMLEERDNRIAASLIVTPLGKWGYLLSRFGIPSAASFLLTAALLPLFRLTALSFGSVLFLSLTGAAQGILIALMIVLLSSNKLEGMAAAKLSTLVLLGMFAPYFADGGMQYLFAPLPSFWIGKAANETHFIYPLMAILTLAAWIGLLLKRYMKKLMSAAG